MRHKPVGTLSRSLGIPVSPRGAKVLEERGYRPGQHGRRRQDVSEYGRRLKEKQRLKAQYYISEKQLRRAFASAARKSGRTDLNLVRDLERRLDAVVLRAGFVRSIYQARQLVSHGHVLVDGARVDRPGYRLRDGQVVGIRERSRSMPVLVAATEGAHAEVVPPYLEVLPTALLVRVVRDAQRDEIPVICDLPLVVEFYAR